MQIYLNLVEERQRLRAINEDELTERGDVASPRDSVQQTNMRGTDN